MRRTLAPVLFALATVGCGSPPPSPGPRVQALADLYAPDLQIGTWVSSAAHRRYKLENAPYTGYRDGTFRSIDGVSELVIRLDKAVGDSPNETTSSWARIDAVTLTIPDSASNALVDARLRQALGTPQVRCYFMPGDTRWRQSYWPGEQGRGALVAASRGPTDGAPGAPARSNAPPVGSGRVTFGARGADVDAPGLPDVCS